MSRLFTRSCLIGLSCLSSLLLALPAWAGSQAETPPSDVHQLLAVIRSHFQKREEALASSRGRAVLELTVNRTPKGDQAFRKGVSRDLGVDTDKWQTSGAVEVVVDWWQKGTKIRFDYPPDDRDDTTGFFGRENMRIAQDGEKSVYYDGNTNCGYIGSRIGKGGNPTSLLNYFRPQFLYDYRGEDVLNQIESHLKGDASSLELDRITTAEVDGINCVGMFFRSVEPRDGGFVMKRERSVWFAPEMAYSLVKGEFTAKLVSQNESIDTHYNVYEAKYHESETVPGVWLIKELYVLVNEFATEEEILKVKVEEAHVGVDVPDEIFTFAGMGVPENASGLPPVYVPT